MSGSGINTVLKAQKSSRLTGSERNTIKIPYSNIELEEVMMTHMTNKANVISMVIQRSSLLSFGFY